MLKFELMFNRKGDPGVNFDKLRQEYAPQDLQTISPESKEFCFVLQSGKKVKPKDVELEIVKRLLANTMITTRQYVEEVCVASIQCLVLIIFCIFILDFVVSNYKFWSLKSCFCLKY